MIEYKKIRKGIGRFIGFIFLSFFSLIIKWMPVSWAYRFSRFIGGLGFFLARKQRRVALESLSVAFGTEKSPRELAAIAKESFICMAKSAVEVVIFMERIPLLAERIQITGKEHLDAAIAKGKGVVLASGHFGNFPLMLARLAFAGYKTAAIMRPMRDRRVEKIFLKKRQRLNIKTIYSQPRKACVEQSIRALRDNEILLIPVDQNFGTGGVFVDFFGVKAATATGAAVLARRTQAAILPCFIIRQPDDTQRIVIEPIMELEGGSSAKETITVNMQRLTRMLEDYVRRYPEQWGWIHRRWKSRPPEAS